jgi:PAS domain S-box-containing protein
MTQTFDRGLAIGLVLVVVLLAWSTGLSWRNTQVLHDNSVRMAQTHAVLDALDRLVATVADAETGARGFVIAGDRRYLAPYNAAVAAIDEEIHYLSEAVRDSPRQQRRFATLKRSIAARREQLREVIAAYSEGGFPAARRVTLDNQGRRTMDAIRATASEMRRLEQETLRTQAQQSRRSYAIATAMEIMTGLLALGAVCALIYLLRRHLRARERAAAELRAEKERFATTLASIADAVVATDTEGRVTYLNPVAEALTGWTLDQAKDQPLARVFQIVDEESRGAIENPALRAVQQAAVIGLEDRTVLIARDGAERPIAHSAAPIRGKDQGIVGASLVFRDITERKRAERALKFLADSGAILSSSLNYDATLKNVARLATSAIADYCFFDLVTDAGEVKRVAWAHRDPDKQAQMSDIWRFVPALDFKRDPVIKTLTTGQSQLVPRVDDEWLRNTATSPEHYQYLRNLSCRSYMTAPVAVKGRTLGALSFCLTEEHRRFTEADRTLAEELGRRAGLAVQNALLHQQLQQTAAELRETDRRKDEFLAVLAHELRNPLAPLRNGLQIMRTLEGDASAADRTHQMMERQLRQMVRLIDDLLDLSRVTEGKLELRKERVDLASIIDSAVDVSGPVIEEAGQELSVVLPTEPVVLEADAVRLTQVFSNLLHNSAKHAGRGARITLSAIRDGDEVVVTVKDTGIGIPADMLDKLFEPFTQLPEASDGGRGGLGIGLTLVKQLVAMHGGTVQARSEGMGRGSEFIVRLPAPAALTIEQPTAASEPAANAAAKAACRVLVADDNEDAANSLHALLRMIGYDARAVYDGEQAVNVAEMFRPHVILLDIGMPKLSGLEAARAIRARPWGRKVALIALTGYGQNADRQRSIEAGIDHHIVKPVDPAALERLLASVCPRG